VQRRGGAASAATTTKDEDFIDKLFVANTHDTLLCFSNRGKVYWLRGYELPQAGRGARGKPLVNLLPLEEGEKHQRRAADQAVRRRALRVHGDQPRHVKKTRCRGLLAAAPAGIIAVDLRDGDRLVGVALTDGKRDMHAVLQRRQGDPLQQEDESVRWAATPPACAASARRGQEVISLVVVATAHPHRLRERLRQADAARGIPAARPRRPGRDRTADHGAQRPHGRGAAGQPGDEIMLISSTGTLVRTPVARFPSVGRNTQGVRLIRLDEGERLVGLDRIIALAGDDDRNRRRGRIQPGEAPPPEARPAGGSPGSPDGFF
jgi:DNA gyrase subunit A